ncbi:MAG: hypothetical protein AB7S26_26490 [Sandaracinaceae bacterium]
MDITDASLRSLPPIPVRVPALGVGLILALAGCGGGTTASRPTAAQLAAEDEEDRITDEEDDADGDDDDGFVDTAMLREQETEPLTLGEPTVLPGTGVTLRPPDGADRIPFGSGFVAMRQRIQVSVAVAVGAPSLIEAVRYAGGQSAPEPEEVEEIRIGGVEARLGRDVVRAESARLERVWLLAHDGHRGLGIVATYEASRGRGYRDVLREALRTVQWDREAELDASAALGITLDPVPGLALSRRTNANLVMVQPNGEFPPQAGEPVITVSPLPLQVPPDQADAACPRIVAQLVPVPSSDIELEGEIDDGQMSGCERLATAPTSEGPRVVTYVAVLFHQGVPFLLSGSADASQLTTWRPRFVAAARSLHPRATN